MQFSEDQLKVINSRNRNLLVSAAAGSGKTAVLVERILSLITEEKDKTDLDRILVVTFTVAAAAEMKDRIGAALEKRLEEDPENEYLQHQAVLIHHAQIGTIHSFCSTIIRNYFYKIDMDPVFRVMEEGEKKLMFQDVLSGLLEDRYAENDEDFEFLVTNWFEGKTDERLAETIEALYDTAITTPWPNEWLKKAAAEYDTEKIREALKQCGAEKDDTEEEPDEDRAVLREELLQNLYCAPAVRVLASVTEELIERFDARKRDKGVCDFSDLEHLALEILYEKNENGERVRSDAAKELASRFRYIMTDEYQDSNLVQEAILHAISGNEDGVYNRFMVGDIKQSIYGFRQARPDIFLQKYKEYEAGSDTCERIDLHTNYRSRPEVINSVNCIFERLMNPELGGIEYDEKAALQYGGTYPETGPDGPAEFILMDKKNPDLEGMSAADSRRIEAQLVAGRIRQIVGQLPVFDKAAGVYRPCRYADIAVLFQISSGVADIFAKELMEQGIPCHSVSKEGYFSATEVVTVLNMLSILDNPIQDIPFAAVLFSPMADLSAQELAKIREENPEADYYHACLHYQEAGKDQVLREKLGDFLEKYEKLRAQAVYTPVHELIENIFRATGYRNLAAAMPGGEQRAANLDMLAAKAKKFETTSYHGLFNFIRYIGRLQKYSVDEGEVNLFSDTADTVRLMTIHKSKGLEFPVVFLCDTSHPFNIKDTSGRFLFHPDLGIGMDACDLEKHRVVKGIRKQRIADRKKEEAYAEYLRVLYVALTRAREKLYITAVEPDLEKMFTELTELKPDPETVISKGVILQYKRFSAWLLLALYGMKKDFIRVRIETPSMTEEKLERQKKGEKGFFERLMDLDETTVYDAALRQILDEVKAFVYPCAMPAGLPGKMTVSQLKYLSGEMNEEEQGELFEKEPVAVPYLPSFETGAEDRTISGAQRGTIYHKVFERIDYAKIEDDSKEAAEDYVRFLMESMVEKGILSETEAGIVRLQDFAGFLLSPIGKRMKAADRRGNLRREQAFTFSIPANEAESSWPAEEELLVQGIIDAYFWEEDDPQKDSLEADADSGDQEQGAYVIVDYKTDFVPDDGSALVDKYGKQVYYYARALEAATGKKVKEKIIYSTYLRKAISCT